MTPPPLPHDTVSDETLMRRFSEAHDGSALDDLARRYAKPAVAIARRYLGTTGRHLAEDAAQEAFVRLFVHGARFDNSRPFAAWFYTILRNVCADFRRHGVRQQALLERFSQDPSCHRHTPPATPSERDLLMRLNPQDREVLIYRLVHGMSCEEIAATLGCNLESAKKRAQRALQRLRQAVAQEKSATHSA